MNRKMAAFALFLSVIQGVWAQKREMGIGLGATNYRGDLAPRVQFVNTRFGSEVFYRHYFNPVWAVRFGVFLGFFDASDSHLSDVVLRQRGYSMSSFMGSGNVLIEYNFFNFRGKGYGRMNFTPYLFAGAAVGLAQSREIKTAQSRSLFLPVFPYGIGIRKAVGENWSYGIEYTTLQLFTDEFDLTPYNPGTTQRNDVLYSLNLTVAYRFVRVACPRCIPNQKVFKQ